MSTADLGSTADTGLPSREQNCLVRFSFLLQKTLEVGFARLGTLVGKYPLAFLLISGILSAACSAGIQLQKSESRTEKLWVPQNSQALKEQEWVRDTFGFGGRTGYILARPTDESDALQPSLLADLLRAHFSLLSVKATALTHPDNQFPDVYTYDDATNTTNPPQVSICSRRPPLCYTSTIFNVLGTFNETEIRNMNRAEILRRINIRDNYRVTLGFQTVYTITESDIFGGLSKDANNQITGAAIVRSVYRMTSAVINVGNQFEDPSREGWERQAFKDISGLTFGSQTDIVVWFSQVFSDDFSGAIGGDLTLFGVGAVLLIGYMTIALGKRDYVHSMAGISIAAVVCVGLSIGASYGLSALFGVFVTPLTSSMPFLILGLGVDDAFIIAGEFQAVGINHPEYDIIQRMSETMKHAGVSILITSVTDVTAFLIGASTVLPALSAFCIYAALGVVFVFILNVTLFPAALVIDAKRTGDNRMDCLCCVKLETPHVIAPPEGEELPYCCYCEKIPQNLTRKVCKRVAETLLLWPVRIGVLCVTAGLLAFCIVGATRLTQDFRLEWFLPDDSPLQKYYSWNDQYFTNDVPVLGYTRELNYPSADVGRKLNATNRLFRTESYLTGFVNDWHESFLNWAQRNGTVLTANNWYTKLREFTTQREGLSVSGFIAWNNPDIPQNGIKGAYMFGLIKQAEVANADLQVKSMFAIRDAYKKIMPIEEGFPFSFAFGFWEQFAVISEEMWRNIALAVLSVFLITTILIPKLLASFLVLVVVCLSIVDLLGFMYWWGLTIDAVTVVYLVIAIGLSVDYSAHIGEAFMLSKKKTREERVVDTMYRMGASVFNGAFSTFLAVLVMAFARTYIFRVFFQQFFLVTVFGSAHGLLVLPIFLATCGPTTTLAHDETIKVGEKVATRESMVETPVPTVELEAARTDGDDTQARAV